MRLPTYGTPQNFYFESDFHGQVETYIFRSPGDKIWYQEQHYIKKDLKQILDTQICYDHQDVWVMLNRIEALRIEVKGIQAPAKHILYSSIFHPYEIMELFRIIAQK